jgi:uncharacterized membrane protein HdeD (DUF308 family)
VLANSYFPFPDSCIYAQAKLLLEACSGEHMKIAGIVLIIAGVVALVYGGFTYTTTKKAVDMGPIQINTKQNHAVPLPPVLGIIAIVGGGALLYFGAKKA